jgi:putative thioredoxin
MRGLLLVIASFAADSPAAWYQDYAAARDAAIAADRPLLVLLCDSSSPYSTWIPHDTFLSDKVERTLRERYVRLFIDTETESGRKLASQFEVERGPHWVIMDRSGRWQVYYQSGNLYESELAGVLARFSDAKLDAEGKPLRRDARTRLVAAGTAATVAADYVTAPHPGTRIINVGEAEFHREIIERSHEHPVVVDFWAEWCGPCRALAPTLERVVSESRSQLTLAKVNIDHSGSLAQRYGVTSIPAVKVFRNGKPMSEFVGVLPEARVRQFIASAAATSSPEQVARLPLEHDTSAAPQR